MFFRAIYLDKTTVLVGQMDQLQNHNHKYYRGSANYGDFDKDLVGDANTPKIPPAQSNLVAMGRTGDETRSKNISIKIWKRIA